MWSSVPPGEHTGPPARSKHSATLLGGQLYLFGGRNGNVPLKDLWVYNLAEGRWKRLAPSGDSPPCLQEHSAVAYRGELWVFGGEVGFASSSETPLWVYNVQKNRWRKVRGAKRSKDTAAPNGRRGHCALVLGGHMMLHGGYQDLRGSTNELWAFHFETETWKLLWPRPGSPVISESPPARHKHSAVVHGQGLWVYGGMTDLLERQDCWRWDTVSHSWSCLRTKINPGPLHSHAACRIPGAMLLFGGESAGRSTNDIWRLHFGLETWERLQIPGIKPQPRTESVALAVSPLHLRPSCDPETQNNVQQDNTAPVATHNHRYSSYLPSTNNRVSPYNTTDNIDEKTYVFKPTNTNYTDGSSQQNQAMPSSGGFLKEISKLSQINMSRLNPNKCNYSVLISTLDSSTESLVNQCNTQDGSPMMVKSHSSHFVNKKRNGNGVTPSPTTQDNSVPGKTNTSQSRRHYNMPREPISVPNFRALTLTTPVLSPVEAARLVFLDSDEEEMYDNDVFDPPCGDHDIIQVRPAPGDNSFTAIHKRFQPHSESYSSHLHAVYENVPHVAKSASVRFQEPETETRFMEDVESTSDYASIETVNRLGSSCYSISKTQDSTFGFCNPNYMGPDINELIDRTHIAKLLHTPDSVLEDRTITSKQIQRLLNCDSSEKHKRYEFEPKQIAKLLNTPDSVLEDQNGRSTSRVLFPLEEMVELKSLGAPPNKTTSRKQPPNSLPLGNGSSPPRARAKSAGRGDCSSVPVFVYVLGGKEQQASVFHKPLSVWRLQL